MMESREVVRKDHSDNKKTQAFSPEEARRTWPNAILIILSSLEKKEPNDHPTFRIASPAHFTAAKLLVHLCNKLQKYHESSLRLFVGGESISLNWTAGYMFERYGGIDGIVRVNYMIENAFG